jgi:hypothetical protein
MKNYYRSLLILDLTFWRNVFTGGHKLQNDYCWTANNGLLLSPPISESSLSSMKCTASYFCAEVPLLHLTSVSDTRVSLQYVYLLLRSSVSQHRTLLLTHVTSAFTSPWIRKASIIYRQHFHWKSGGRIWQFPPLRNYSMERAAPHCLRRHTFHCRKG